MMDVSQAELSAACGSKHVDTLNWVWEDSI